MNKAKLLNGLQDENQQWQALLDQIGVAHMDQPGVAGDWSVKDVVAHLTSWRRRTVARFEAAQRGAPEPPPHWPADLQTDEEINAWIYAANRDRPVQEVLDASQQVFEELLAAIAGLPDAVLADPAQTFPWWDGPPFTVGDFFAHFHEEHEPDLRAWLARIDSP